MGEGLWRVGCWGRRGTFGAEQEPLVVMQVLWGLALGGHPAAGTFLPVLLRVFWALPPMLLWPWRGRSAPCVTEAEGVGAGREPSAGSVS